MTKKDLLKKFQAKARCRTTQYIAESTWRRLKPHLSQDEACKLLTAWEHALSYEGPAELDELCNAMLK